jgi:pyruvate,water dikinase
VTIAWFRDISKGDVGMAGGKGANLGELTNAGIRVPPGFVVTTAAYEVFSQQDDLLPHIGRLLDSLDASDHAALQVVSQEIKALVTAAHVPDATAEAIGGAYDGLGAETRVAVRSSATAEDLAGASFAGQQATYLNIAGPDAVVEAVKSCWASLFEPQAIAYRARAGFGQLEVKMAVVVQAMVQSERSGVMFTINPVTSDAAQMVVEAVYGLGEACVSGQVTPDTYIVDKASLSAVERSISEQDRQLVFDPEVGSDVWRDIEPAVRSGQKIADETIAELARLGVRIEEHYGAPQDVEWALAGGDLYVLQARPVTTV